MPIYRRKDGLWSVYYYRDHKKVFEYFGRGELGEARARAREAQLQAERPHRICSGPTIELLLSEYHKRHLREASTMDTDWYRLDRVLLPALGTAYAEALTTDQVDDYVRARLDAGRKPSTVTREIAILKAAYAWAERRQPPLVLRNPMRAYRIQRGKHHKPVAEAAPISQDELRKLAAHAPDHLLRAMLLLWYGGERPGRELLGITWGDVDLEGRRIRIVSAHKGAAPVRWIPIHSALAPKLLEWLEKDKPMADRVEAIPLVHYKGRQVKSLKTAWVTAKRRAGITRKLRLYDFRHAWFSNALRGGADLKSTSEVGGHSRADTTMLFYQHTTMEQHRAAVESVPDFPAGPRLAHTTNLPPRGAGHGQKTKH